MKKIEYPDICFWNRESPKIELINEDDFRKRILIEKLEIFGNPLTKSLGVTDREEVLKRSSIMKFIARNPRIFRLFRGSFDEAYLPTTGQEFLDHFNPKRKNKFWKKIDAFVRFVRKREDVPEEILSFADFIEGTRDEMIAAEQEMAKGISDKLQKACFIEGIVQMGGPDEGFYVWSKEVIGYKKYSFGLTGLWRDMFIPEWSRRWLFKWNVYHAFHLFSRIMKKIRNKIFYSPTVVEKIPSPIYDSLDEFNHELHDSMLGLMTGSATITLYFRYAENRLEAKMINIEVKPENKDIYVPKFNVDYPGYSKSKRKKIEKREKTFGDNLESINTDFLRHKLVYLLADKYPDLIHGTHDLGTSPSIEDELKWYAIEMLYTSPEFREQYEFIKEYREYVRERAVDLFLMSHIFSSMKERAKKWKRKLHFGEIAAESDDIFSFDELFPFHIIGEEKVDKSAVVLPKHVVPITALPSINGNMIGLTGNNAAGKSTTKEAMLYDIFLTQSGLPTFSKGIRLNIKKKLGMIFLERGSGSTCELLLLKGKKLLESIPDDNKNGILLAVDEVGTGTEEIGGIFYGKKFLSKLHQSGCSVVFSTQIPELARFSQDELGAHCFSVSADRTIRPGIGHGDIESLMKKTGIDKYLN